MSKKTILLIDDDRELAQGLALRIGSEFDATAVCAHDLSNAVNQLQHVTPDLVICDVKLPTGNGLSLCELMDQDERWSKIPAIVLTGYSDGHTLRRIANLCAYYVHKSGDLWPRLKKTIEETARFRPRTGSVRSDAVHADVLRP